MYFRPKTPFESQNTGRLQRYHLPGRLKASLKVILQLEQPAVLLNLECLRLRLQQGRRMEREVIFPVAY